MRFTLSPVAFAAVLASVWTPFAAAELPPVDCPPIFGPSVPHRFMWNEAMAPKPSPLSFCEGGESSDCLEVSGFSAVLPQDGGSVAPLVVVNEETPNDDISGIAPATTDPVTLMMFSSAGKMGPFRLRRMCFALYHKTADDLGLPTFFVAPVDSEDPEKCGTPVDCTNLPEGSFWVKKLFRSELLGTAAKICVDLEAVCAAQPFRPVCKPIWKFAISSYHPDDPPKECALLAIKLLDVCTADEKPE